MTAGERERGGWCQQTVTVRRCGVGVVADKIKPVDLRLALGRLARGGRLYGVVRLAGLVGPLTYGARCIDDCRLIEDVQPKVEIGAKHCWRPCDFRWSRRIHRDRHQQRSAGRSRQRGGDAPCRCNGEADNQITTGSVQRHSPVIRRDALDCLVGTDIKAGNCRNDRTCSSAHRKAGSRRRKRTFKHVGHGDREGAGDRIRAVGRLNGDAVLGLALEIHRRGKVKICTGYSELAVRIGCLGERPRARYIRNRQDANLRTARRTLRNRGVRKLDLRCDHPAARCQGGGVLDCRTSV